MNFDRYIGIPWRDHGLDREGCSCWGLLRLVYGEQLGLDLPAYSDRYVTAVDRHAIAALIAGEKDLQWREIAPGQERAFDGVLLRSSGRISHVGMVIAPGRMLHVSRASGTSEVIDYRGGAWRHRIAGFYRHINA